MEMFQIFIGKQDQSYIETKRGKATWVVKSRFALLSFLLISAG